MNEIIISRSGQEMVLYVPCLTSVGEEFELNGKFFRQGTIGKVISVIGQVSGFTKIKVAIVKGEIIASKTHLLTDKVQARREEVYNEAQNNRIIEQDIIDAPSETNNYWPGMDNDPRPRTGLTDNNKNVEQIIDDSGSIIIIKNDEPSSLTVSNPKKTGSHSFSSILSKVTGIDNSSDGHILTNKEIASSMGKEITNEVGAYGARRRSGINKIK